MFLMHLTVLDVESTLCILSVDRKREVSKLNVGVVLIIAVREISNHENEFDVNSRNICPRKLPAIQYFLNFCVLIVKKNLQFKGPFLNIDSHCVMHCVVHRCSVYM